MAALMAMAAHAQAVSLSVGDATDIVGVHLDPTYGSAGNLMNPERYDKLEAFKIGDYQFTFTNTKKAPAYYYGVDGGDATLRLYYTATVNIAAPEGVYIDKVTMKCTKIAKLSDAIPLVTECGGTFTYDTTNLEVTWTRGESDPEVNTFSFTMPMETISAAMNVSHFNLETSLSAPQGPSILRLSLADATNFDGTHNDIQYSEDGSVFNPERWTNLKAFDIATYHFNTGTIKTQQPSYFIESTPVLRLYYGNTINIVAPEGKSIDKVTLICNPDPAITSMKYVNDTYPMTSDCGGTFTYDETARTVVWTRDSDAAQTGNITLTLPTAKAAAKLFLTEVEIEESALTEVPEPTVKIIELADIAAYKAVSATLEGENGSPITDVIYKFTNPLTITSASARLAYMHDASGFMCVAANDSVDFKNAGYAKGAVIEGLSVYGVPYYGNAYALIADAAPASTSSVAVTPLAASTADFTADNNYRYLSLSFTSLAKAETGADYLVGNSETALNFNLLDAPTGWTPEEVANPDLRLRADAEYRIEGIYQRVDKGNGTVESYILPLSIAEHLATPVISPDPNGDYPEGVTVSMSAAEGADIYYTVDGTSPSVTFAEGVATPAEGTMAYTNPFTLFENASVCAIAYKADMAESRVASANYIAGAMVSPTTSTSTIYGYLTYSEPTAPYGWYLVEQDATLTHQWSNEGADQNKHMRVTWVKDGKVCGMSMQRIGAGVAAYEYKEIDLESGETLVSTPIEKGSSDLSWIFLRGVYVEDEDKVYGFTLNKSGEFYNWSSAPASDMSDVTTIRELVRPEPLIYAMCYNPIEKEIIGIRRSGDVMRLNLDGTTELLFNLGLPQLSQYETALVYSPLDGYYIYNPAYADGTTGLVAFDTQSKTCRQLAKFQTPKEFSFLWSPDQFSPKAPQAPAADTNTFGNGKLNGTVTFVLPEKTLNENTISGDLTWICTLDGVKYSSGTAKPGAKVTISFTNLKQGLHAFALKATLGKLESPLCSQMIYVGNDTPLAPKNVVLTETKLTWDAVTAGVNSGYLDTAAVVYNVSLNGVSLGTTSDTSYAITLPEGKSLTPYRATVTATAHDMTSKVTTSNKVIYGEPFTPSIGFFPTADQADLFTVVDANADGVTWYLDSEYGSPVFSYQYSYKNADDWLILPAISLKGGKYYEFNFDTQRADLKRNAEYIEVRVGKSTNPAEMEQVVLEKTQVPSSTERIRTFFPVESDGVHYVAIRCLSNAYQYKTLVYNFELNNSAITPESPKCVDNIVATAGEKGALQATISFTMPTERINGSSIAADVEIEAVVCAEEDGSPEFTVKGLPGSTQSITVATIQGYNKLLVSCREGKLPSTVSTVNVFTGFDKPAEPTNFLVEYPENPLEALISWDAVDKGANGYYVDPEKVTYYLAYKNNGVWEISQELGTGVRQIKIGLKEGSPLAIRSIGIIAENEYGQSEVGIADLVTGVPYSIPVEETFEGLTYLLKPTYVYRKAAEGIRGSWVIVNTSDLDAKYANESGVALKAYASSATGKGRLVLPKVSTEGFSNVTFSITAWTGDDMPVIKVLGQCAGVSDFIEIGTVARGEGWQTQTFTLPEQLNGKKWIGLYLQTEFDKENQMALISHYSYGGTNSVGQNMADKAQIVSEAGGVTIHAPKAAQFSIITADGAVLMHGLVEAGVSHYNLNSGMYIIRVGDAQAKIMVK